MVILLREFQTQDEEMKKIVLKVVMQCVQTEGVEPSYVRTEVLQEFFRNFWQRKMALDRRNYKQVVETTVALGEKVGCTDIVGQIKGDLKDESEPYRRMVMETIDKVISSLGTADIDARRVGHLPFQPAPSCSNPSSCSRPRSSTHVRPFSFPPRCAAGWRRSSWTASSTRSRSRRRTRATWSSSTASQRSSTASSFAPSPTSRRSAAPSSGGSTTRTPRSASRRRT